ncbi:MAG: ABC transporter permease [Marmoricola sp.]
MSAAEASASTPRGRRRWSTRFLRSELRLAFGRRRNQLGLLVLVAPPILIAVAVKTTASQPGRDAPNFFASITENGLFVALAALTIELALLLPLAVSVVSGDAVAGEASTGTLRYLLTVPVSRTRLLAVKYAGIVLFTYAATFLVAIVGVLIGLALFGGGDLTLLSGTQLGIGAGFVRVLGAALYLGTGLVSLGAVGLFLSTLTEQPIAATLATVVFSTASFILDSIPQVAAIHPYLITHEWAAFADLFRDPIAWSGTGHGLWLALGYTVVFLLAAWARFSSKDVTS